MVFKRFQDTPRGRAILQRLGAGKKRAPRGFAVRSPLRAGRGAVCFLYHDFLLNIQFSNILAID